MTYVAAPFFNDKEIEILNHLRAFLVNHFPETDFFFPCDHKIPGGENMSNSEWAEHIYNMDVNALRESDAVIAVYFGHYSDSGVAWKVGYASALNKPITLLVVNPKENQSIMPINSANFVFDFYEFCCNVNTGDIINELNQK